MNDPKPPIPEAMVEIVARALYEVMPGNGGRKWADLSIEHRMIYQTNARAALLALTDSGFVILPKEPTVEMMRAASMLDEDADTLDIYRAMRDAAMGKE